MGYLIGQKRERVCKLCLNPVTKWCNHYE